MFRSYRRKLSSLKIPSNSNARKYMKSNTYPGKFEENIDAKAEKFIKRKLKHIGVDGDDDLKSEMIIEKKGGVSKQRQEDDVFVDVKAEEFINKKKSELTKVSLDAG